MPGRQSGVTKEALSRLPDLDLRELQELWRRLYKTATAPRLGRELLMRAVAYRVQELAAGGLRPELQRQLQQIAREPQIGRTMLPPRVRLKPGTRLLREWKGRSHEVLVLDDGLLPHPVVQSAHSSLRLPMSPSPRHLCPGDHDTTCIFLNGVILA